MSRQWNGTDLKRLHRGWARRSPGRLALVLDGVGSPYNVGALVRTAAAYKVDHLWCAGPAAAVPAHPGSRKISLGTERYVEWTHADSAVQAVSDARFDGFFVVGIELADGAVALHELTAQWDGERDVCLVLGHEDHGLSNAVAIACDRLAYLPQLGRVGSLNVATAGALAMYEVRRHAWTGSDGDAPDSED